MAHPQNSPRGLFAKWQITIGDTLGNSSNLTANSSGVLFSAGIAMSGEATDFITQNSTAIFFPSKIALNGEATDLITQNSTAVTFPSQIRLSGTSRFLVADSTGILIGARYISTNTTGNLTT